MMAQGCQNTVLRLLGHEVVLQNTQEYTGTHFKAS